MQGVSLILTTNNRNKDCEFFIENLFSNKINSFLIQLIIIDQNSYNTLEVICSKFHNPFIEITYKQANKMSLSAARNLGLQFIKYEIVGFPDDDCWYNFDTLYNIHQSFNSNKGDIILSKWIESEESQANKVQIISRKAVLTFKNKSICSITIFIKKNILIALNGFDERLGLGNWYSAGEDNDLIIRAAKKRYTILYDPNVIIHHRLKNDIELNNYHRALGTGALYIKNKLPIHVIFKGLLSPLVRMFLNYKKNKYYFSVFKGRFVGLIAWALGFRR